mgnify:FL=1
MPVHVESKKMQVKVHDNDYSFHNKKQEWIENES